METLSTKGVKRPESSRRTMKAAYLERKAGPESPSKIDIIAIKSDLT
jgi:hypothetical protein